MTQHDGFPLDGDPPQKRQAKQESPETNGQVDLSGQPPSRRELNKVRTRESIVEALRTLVRQQPVHRITVDMLAEEAGISRRTFFNYFAGIPALVSEIIAVSTQHLAGQIEDLPTDVSPFRYLRTLIAEVGIPTDLIEWLALLNLHGSDDIGATTFERTVWTDKGAWLEQVLHSRLPDAIDPLYVATLADTIMTSFAAAERSWVARRAPGAAVDQAAVDDFTSLLEQALAYAEHGWATPSFRKDS